jgi:hypothetical protein
VVSTSVKGRELLKRLREYLIFMENMFPCNSAGKWQLEGGERLMLKPIFFLVSWGG